jgi:hypothetical protein
VLRRLFNIGSAWYESELPGNLTCSVTQSLSDVHRLCTMSRSTIEELRLRTERKGVAEEVVERIFSKSCNLSSSEWHGGVKRFALATKYQKYYRY